MTASRLGLAIAILTLVLDQASKLFLLFGYDLPANQPVTVARFLEFVVVWNRGISYGLFQQENDLGRWILIVLSLAASIWLTLWLWRTAHRFLAASLGLIVGGAVGNAIDRIAYGAVFDFVHVHAGSFSWYVFNVADAGIVAGVIGLLYDSLVLEGRRTRAASPSTDGTVTPP
ncbi:signal peptidase II [Salinarimonas soli]|uniref:Lipoprotein signal peptidase n=1 Tax=Salinarimonas soli TaxID=1638099 RepID=A0A5B2V6F7_9HYPH|nr:signal peptidase II [Salinarimonas soli]KAA2235113.1 signal peptidase II [Salinarimonas soli]